MRTLLARFATDASGTTAIEYSLIGSLLSITIVIGVLAIGADLNTILSDIAQQLDVTHPAAGPADARGDFLSKGRG